MDRFFPLECASAAWRAGAGAAVWELPILYSLNMFPGGRAYIEVLFPAGRRFLWILSDSGELAVIEKVLLE